MKNADIAWIKLFGVIFAYNRQMLAIGLSAVPRISIKNIHKVWLFWCGSKDSKLDILTSQFHAKGVKHFQKSRMLNRSSTTAIFEIDKLITELEKHRIKMKELKEASLIRSDAEIVSNGQCTKYFDIYAKLREKMKDVKINEEWGYRTVGWYNMQPFLDDLIEELLSRGNKADQNSLIESISWMQPHNLNINTEDTVQELIKQKAKIDNFYKQLIVSYSINTLKVIQSIFEQANTNSKGKYYHHYLATNSDQIIDNFKCSQQEIDDILWILEMYVITFNDEPSIITKFQNLFLRTKLLQRQDAVRTFIKIYNQMGRTNQQIYQLYIRPYLKKSQANVIQVQIMNLQFLIHGEVADEELLNDTLKNIAKIARSQPIADGQRLHVHYLLHYLKIKNIRFSFPFQIFREFNEVCRNFEQDGTFAKIVAVQLDEKSRREGVQYFNSSCVLKKKQFDSPKKAKQGEPVQKMEGVKKFKDVKFCCLNIDFCVYDQTNKKGTILQKNYHRFFQSGRLIRMQQVKAELLKHYDLQINYMQTKSELSKHLQK